MKIIKYISLAICVAIIATCYFGCSGSGDGSYKKLKVTVILKAEPKTSAFWLSVEDGAKAAAIEHNVEVNIIGPDYEEDFVSQNEMINSAVAADADAIVLSAIDYHLSAEAVDKAVASGVKVVVVDSDVNSKNVSCRIGTDNFAAGVQTGNAIFELINENVNVGIVNFSVTTENGQSRQKGLMSVIANNEKVNNITSINVQSNLDSAANSTKTLLNQNKDINVIVTFNELTSLGVGKAVKEMGVKDEVAVIAFDSNTECIEMLVSGEIDALIVQSPFSIGYLGVLSAFDVLNGKTVDSVITTDTTVVTRENLFEPEIQKIVFSLRD